MKDTIITAKRKKTELLFLFISFIAAIGLNVYAIIRYNTNWIELLSTLHISLILTIIIYCIILFFRLLYVMISKSVCNK